MTKTMNELKELADLITEIKSCMSNSLSAPLSLDSNSEYREKRSSRDEFQIRLDEVLAEEQQVEEYFKTGKYDHIAKRQSLAATSTLKRGILEVLNELDSKLNQQQEAHQLQTTRYFMSLEWLNSWNYRVKPYSLVKFEERQKNQFILLIPKFLSELGFYSNPFNIQTMSISSPIGGATLNSKVGDEIRYFAPTGRERKDIVKETKLPTLELLFRILEFASSATGLTYHVDERYNPHFGGKYITWEHGQDASRFKKGG